MGVSCGYDVSEYVLSCLLCNTTRGLFFIKVRDWKRDHKAMCGQLREMRDGSAGGGRAPLDRQSVVARVLGRVRPYLCPFAVCHGEALGRGFVFVQVCVRVRVYVCLCMCVLCVCICVFHLFSFLLHTTSVSMIARTFFGKSEPREGLALVFTGACFRPVVLVCSVRPMTSPTRCSCGTSIGGEGGRAWWRIGPLRALLSFGQWSVWPCNRYGLLFCRLGKGIWGGCGWYHVLVQYAFRDLLWRTQVFYYPGVCHQKSACCSKFAFGRVSVIVVDRPHSYCPTPIPAPSCPADAEPRARA